MCLWKWNLNLPISTWCVWKWKLNLPTADSLHYPCFFHHLSYIRHLDQWNHAVVKAYSVSCRHILIWEIRNKGILINAPLSQNVSPRGTFITDFTVFTENVYVVTEHYEKLIYLRFILDAFQGDIYRQINQSDRCTIAW